MQTKKKKWQLLQQAMRQDDVEQVLGLTLKLGLNSYNKESKSYDACLLAVHSDASNALEIFLRAAGGFQSFGWNDERNREQARLLIKESLSSSKPLPLLLVLAKANSETRIDSRLSPEDFLTENTPSEIIRFFLEDDIRNFDTCVKNVGLRSTDDKLKLILSFTHRVSNPQPTLDSALVLAAGNGDIEKAKMLLERQADPNYACGQALLHASESGHRDMVAFLLPQTNLGLYGIDIITKLEQAEKKFPADIIDSIEAATQKAVQKTAAEAAPAAAQEESRFKRLNDDTLEEVQPLSDGSTLTTLFNFRLQQQLILPSGNRPATPVSFDTLGEEVVKGLRKIFNALENPSQPQPKKPAVAHNADLIKNFIS